MTNTNRVQAEEALHLFIHAPLGELMARGHALRQERHPDNRVTYVADTNPNYSNVCVTGCRFCAFYRPPGHPEAYRLSPGQLAEKVATAARAGATTALLQGGHDPDMTLDDWLAYIRAIRAACPEIHIHPFSPPEILFLSRQQKILVRDILLALKTEGVTTIPGGGAEILVDRVRNLIAPGKCLASDWLELMEEAHGLGLRTTATMMYGHVETPAEIIEHLLSLRAVQQRTSGFSAFVPWSFKPGNTRLAKDVSAAAQPADYVRVIALSRIVLDNFEHIQSSWFSQDIATGQLGLLAGADDFGGILIEENVLRHTGHAPRICHEEIHDVIRAAGFIPARRDSHYRVCEVFA